MAHDFDVVGMAKFAIEIAIGEVEEVSTQEELDEALYNFDEACEAFKQAFEFKFEDE